MLPRVPEDDAPIVSRRHAEEWATARGLPIAGSHILIREARVPLFAIIGGLAFVHASAMHPIKMTMHIQHTKWLERKATFVTEDAEFDGLWHVTTTNEEQTRLLLDDALRMFLCELEPWCRIAYVDGEVEVCIDDDALTGQHLLDAAELAEMLTVTRLSAGAYR